MRDTLTEQVVSQLKGAGLLFAIHCDFHLLSKKAKSWWLLAYRGPVDEPTGAFRSGRSELSDEPRSVKSECLHGGAGVNRRPKVPLLPLSITKNFGTRMAQAGPSSQRPTKQKQKQNLKRTKKSVLGRQTVELLEKTAHGYVRARLAVHSRAWN